jgi:tetratricopeptide (TPR) repeat protein
MCKKALKSAKEHEATVKIHNTMAVVCELQGETTQLQDYNKKAHEALEKALKIGKRRLPPNHPDVAEAFHNRGKVYNRQGLYTKAIEDLEKSAEMYANIYGTHSVLVAKAQQSLGDVFLNQDKMSKAFEAYGVSLDILKDKLGADHSEVAGAHYHIASIYDFNGYYIKAVDYYKLALDHYNRRIGADRIVEDIMSEIDKCKSLTDSGASPNAPSEASKKMPSVLEGYFEKQSGGMTRFWQQRWIVFKAAGISYYKDPGLMNHCGEFLLQDCKLIESPDLHIFIKTPQGRVHKFRTNDVDQWRTWWKALKENLA